MTPGIVVATAAISQAVVGGLIGVGGIVLGWGMNSIREYVFRRHSETREDRAALRLMRDAILIAQGSASIRDWELLDSEWREHRYVLARALIDEEWQQVQPIVHRAIRLFEQAEKEWGTPKVGTALSQMVRLEPQLVRAADVLARASSPSKLLPDQTGHERA